MVMGGIVWTANHFLTPFIGRYAAIAAIVAGGCVYLALVIGMKIVTLQDLGGILRRKKKA